MACEKPILYLPLNAIIDGTVRDDENRAYAVEGDLTVAEDSKFGRALEFDGNSYINCGDHARFSLVGDLTLEAWILPRQNLHGKCLLSKHFNGEYDLTFWYNAVNYYNGPNWNHNNARRGSFPLDEWSHVAVVRRAASKTVSYYMNGEKIGDDYTYQDEPPKAHKALSIGYRAATGGNGFTGRIAHVRIYGAALSAEEIRSDIDADLVPPRPEIVTDNLVLHLPLNEIVGGKVRDQDDREYSVENLTVAEDSKFGRAAEFDGTSSVDCGNDPRFSLVGDLTLEGWVLPRRNLHGKCLLSKHFDGEYDLTFWYNSVYYYNGPSWNRNNSNRGPVPLDEWSHVAVVRRAASKTVSFYLNGEKIGDDYTYEDEPPKTHEPLGIGLRLKHRSNGFIGRIAHVRIYQAALSADQIAGNIAADLAPPAPVEGPPEGSEIFTFDGNNYKEIELSRDKHSELTIEFWAKRGAREQGVVFFQSGDAGKYPGVRARDSFVWEAGGGARYPNKLEKNVPIADVLPECKWVHLAFVKKAAENRMEIYVDGEVFAEIQGGSDRDAHNEPTALGHFRLGHAFSQGADGRWIIGWMTEHGFEGEMAEVRAWSRALSAEELEAGRRLETARLPNQQGLLMHGPVGGELAKT